MKINKEQKEELLNYEIFMFNKTCEEFKFFKKLDRFNQNLLIESLALHTRVLVDFFYIDNKKYKNDLIAQDLLSAGVDWKNIRPKKPKILEEAVEKANKQLAHLSLYRIYLKNQNKHGWIYQDIKKEMDEIIEVFDKNKL